MANNSPNYFKRFVNRTLTNNIDRDEQMKRTNNFTTITDLLTLPLLPIVALMNLLKRGFDKNK